MKYATQQRLRHVVVTSSTWQAQFEQTGIATNVPCLKANTPLKLRIISPQIAMFDTGTTLFLWRNQLQITSICQIFEKVFWSRSFEGVDTPPAETSAA